MMNTGEPIFDSDPNPDSRKASNAAVPAPIQSLVNKQAYSVQCVQGGDLWFVSRRCCTFFERPAIPGGPPMDAKRSLGISLDATGISDDPVVVTFTFLADFNITTSPAGTLLGNT
jgi:hypothetical protein